VTACVIDASVAAKWFLPASGEAFTAEAPRMLAELRRRTAAILSNAPLVTADERLANALAARYPVRWLGAA
jgi:predicted nucleic acid-binding protein